MSQKKKHLKVGFLSFILLYHKRYYIYLNINEIIFKLRIFFLQVQTSYKKAFKFDIEQKVKFAKEKKVKMDCPFKTPIIS